MRTVVVSRMKVSISDKHLNFYLILICVKILVLGIHALKLKFATRIRGVLRPNERPCTVWAPKLGLGERKSNVFCFVFIRYF